MIRRLALATGMIAGLILPALAAGSFDGQWTGEAIAHVNDRERCGFEKTPFLIQVSGHQFKAIGVDVTGAKRSFEGEIEDGNISVWSKWTTYFIRNLKSNAARLSGTFDGDTFSGSMFVQDSYRGTCSTKLSLDRISALVVNVRPGDEGAKTEDPSEKAARQEDDKKRVELVERIKRLRTDTARVDNEKPKPPAESPSTDADTDLWVEVRDAKTVDELQRYLNAFPAGEHAAAAMARVKQLAEAEIQRAELILWNHVKRSADPATLQSYVDAYPDGLFVDVANVRMQSLGALKIERAAIDEDRIWNSVDGSQNAGDFRMFLARFPQSRYREKAEAGLRLVEKFEAIGNFDFGDYHALVIGNNDYPHLADLKTAVGDARAVADALGNIYRFKVKLLTDATRRDIIEALDTYVETLTERDNLIIYYAGHGWLNEDTGRGYWLPVDARKTRRTNWVSNATVTDTLKSVQAKHVMVVADSCYSGTLTRGAGANLRTADYWKRMAGQRTRVVLSSGGLEPVADSGGGNHSPFARAFIDTLAGNDAVIDGTQLFTKMRRPVMVAADQTPEYSDARNAGHEGGDFLFVRKR